MMLKSRCMVKLKYRKYDFVSNFGVYHMLWLGLKAIFADILYQKPNIMQVKIN
jgi:hypothetical protein